MLGALFHDIGKGYSGDHTDVGIKLFATIGPRIGLAPEDCETISLMIEHHLLLPDVATRRDLSDDATITSVATTVGTTTMLYELKLGSLVKELFDNAMAIFLIFTPLLQEKIPIKFQ